MRVFFVPGHITGFFEIKSHDDLLKSGSRGAGVVLDRGVDTGAVVKVADETTVRVYYNGVECSCPTTQSVVGEMLEKTCGAYEIEIYHVSSLPVGNGFGLSASGSLGAALALNEALELERDYKCLGEVAHIAEVRNRTGLGDVIAELSRGLVIRTKEGAPGKGKTISNPLDGYVVSFIIGEPILTGSVLEDESKKYVINRTGRSCMDRIVKDQSSECFMELSREFARESGLADKEVKRAIMTLEDVGIIASMSMLGNVVFTLTDEPGKVSKILDYPSIVTRPLEKGILIQKGL